MICFELFQVNKFPSGKKGNLSCFPVLQSLDGYKGMYPCAINPLTTAIGRPFFGHKLPAARELFKPSTASASLLADIEKNVFCFGLGVFWR